ncbi:hypothetical protein ACFW15_29350, partial [Streptomyces sp. NPDC058953]
TPSSVQHPASAPTTPRGRAGPGPGAPPGAAPPRVYTYRRGDAWLSARAEVLVPAAVSYAIDTDDAALIGARWVVEAANMPVLPDAEALLARRGVTVLPDVVVNSGTNAWWWWTLFGDIGADADEAFARLRGSMRDLVGAMLTRAEADGTTPRAAAHAIVAERLPLIAERFGESG